MQDVRLWNRVRSLAGIDAAITWSAGPQIWTLLVGPITVALIGTRLTADERGFYFTFGSLLALQPLFDLGLASVTQQLVSHERAWLAWRPDGTLGGDRRHKARLASIVHNAIRWQSGAAFVFAAALIVGGTLFLSQRPESGASWRGAWVAVVVASAAGMLVTPSLTALDGSGAVAEVARVRTAQGIGSDVGSWAMLLLGGGLWAPAAGLAAATGVAAAHVVRHRRAFIVDLVRTRPDALSWRDEICPFHWRTAIAVFSDYLAVQSLTPMLFVFGSAAAAGRLGMSVLIVRSMMVVSMSWVLTKRPQFAHHVSRREFQQLDRLFFPAMIRAFALMVAGAAVFVGAVSILAVMRHPWANRFLMPRSLLLLVGGMLAMHVLSAVSIYLRSHKREALLGVRATGAALIVTIGWWLTSRNGVAGLMAAFFAVHVVVSLGGGIWVFVRKRRQWHADTTRVLAPRTS